MNSHKDPVRKINNFFRTKFMYDSEKDRYVANTTDLGLITAFRVPKLHYGFNLRNKAIVPMGSIYSSLEDFIASQDTQTFDSEALVSRLFDSVYINGRFGKDRRMDMIDEISRDTYEELSQSGGYDAVLAHNLNRILLAASAELVCHLERAGAYVSNTLIYDYSRRIGKRHALLFKKQHAVFI